MSSTLLQLSLSASTWPPQNPLVASTDENTKVPETEEELFYPYQTRQSTIFIMQNVREVDV